MKTITELLSDADPLRQEPAIPSSRRDALRQAVVAAVFAPRSGAMKTRFNFARLATVSIVVISILLLGSRVWPRVGFETHAAVRFEVRLAEDAPTPGLRAAITASGRSIYLHEDIVVGNSDIARAEVLPGRGHSQFVVGVHFTTEGAQKMRAATQNHIGKPVAILIDDEVVMAPILRSAISESAEITGDYTREQAQRIVDGI